MSVINRQPNRLAIEALRLSGTDSVLELGVGPGWALRRIEALSRCGRIFGIDQSAEMLALAAGRARSAMRRGRLLLAQAKFEALPFPNDSFDRLLAVNIAYFFNVDGRDFREARRVLRPGVAAWWSMCPIARRSLTFLLRARIRIEVSTNGSWWQPFEPADLPSPMSLSSP